jgi:phosphoglycerate dehydrogenase-like enzyme
MYTLLILSKNAREYRDLIEMSLPDLDVVATADLDEAATLGSHCQLALGEPPLLRAMLPRLGQLTWMQATWAGVEPLLEPSLRRDYQLTNACGVFGTLITEYVIGYLLAHERRVIDRYRLQQASTWDPSRPGTLRGKTIGILGVGSIGAAVAKTAKHFGMRVNGYTRVSESCADVDRYFHGVDRLAFAAGLDYLVNTTPNTGETRHLVDAALLQALPPHAVFVNVGRGSAVDEPALIRALREGRLAAAVLDVFEQEPLPPDHVLWHTPGVLITSHTAALTVVADVAALFVENYGRLRRGEPLRCQVNFTSGY